MKDVIIIGAGIFGSVIGKYLQQKGLSILAIDDDKEYSGSKPAACLMKPSWCTAMGKESYKQGIETLESVYDVKTIEFYTQVAKTKVKWIDPKSILENQIDIRTEDIQKLYLTPTNWEVETTENSYSSKYIIIAAGVWSNQILLNLGIPQVPGLAPMTGTSFMTTGKVQKPQILLWRPYKQIVYWEMYPEQIWIGDGDTAKNYNESNMNKSRERCAGFLQHQASQLQPQVGHRPYVKGVQPCYLESHAPNLWVCTGGAKNGTVSAGWAARELYEKL